MVTQSVAVAEAVLAAELEELAAQAAELELDSAAIMAIIRHTSDELWDLQEESRWAIAELEQLNALLLEPGYRHRARQLSRLIARRVTCEHFRDQFRARVAEELHRATIAANCTDGRLWRIRRQIAAMIEGPEEPLEDLPF